MNPCYAKSFIINISYDLNEPRFLAYSKIALNLKYPTDVFKSVKLQMIKTECFLIKKRCEIQNHCTVWIDFLQGLKIFCPITSTDLSISCLN